MKGYVTIFFVLVLFASFTPPGTQKVKKGFYMDSREIQVSDWLEYAWYLKRDSMDKEHFKYKAALPDSTLFNHSHFMFDNPPINTTYPIVGVTYEQVVAYCKWRSVIVNKKYHKKVVYRLPTPEEWIEFANKNALQADHSKNSDSIERVSYFAKPFLGDYYIEKKIKKADYNLTDNVSEMTSEKGISMGNNFTDKEKGLARHEYTKPEKWLGFRCACEVVN